MVAPTLVDSNVILDIVTEDPVWQDWSADALARCADRGRLVINPLIYAEVSIGFERIEDLEDALPGDYFTREPLPWQAAFLAGKAFHSYRKRQGVKRHPLPDFLYWRPRRTLRVHLTDPRPPPLPHLLSTIAPDLTVATTSGQDRFSPVLCRCLLASYHRTSAPKRMIRP